jgi:hypothetical protein
MMRNLIIFLIIIILSGTKVMAQEQQPVPYTLADRDRLIKVETEISSVRNEMNSLRNEMHAFRNEINAKLESQQKQIDDIKTLFFWGFSIIITLIIFMLGYMIWDRRTALKPALLKAEDANDKTRNLVSVLREYARAHPDLAEILKTYGLL